MSQLSRSSTAPSDAGSGTSPWSVTGGVATKRKSKRHRRNAKPLSRTSESDDALLAPLIGNPNRHRRRGPASAYGLAIMTMISLLGTFFIPSSAYLLHFTGIVAPLVLLTIVASQTYTKEYRLVTLACVIIVSMAFLCFESIVHISPMVRSALIALAPILMRLRIDSTLLFITLTALGHVAHAWQGSGDGVAVVAAAATTVPHVIIFAVLMLLTLIMTRIDGSSRQPATGPVPVVDQAKRQETSDALLRRQWSRSPLCVMVYSGENIVFVNQNCQALLGASDETMSNPRHYITIKGADAQEDNERSQSYLNSFQDEDQFVQMFGCDSEGNIFPGSVAKVTEWYQGKKVLVLSIMPHPEGNLMASLLFELQSKMNDLLDTSSIPMVQTDNTSKIVKVNPAATAILGISPSLVGKDMNDPSVKSGSTVLGTILADWDGDNRSPSLAHQRSPMPSLHGSNKSTSANSDGQNGFIEWSRLPVVDTKGQVQGSIICIDPTPPGSPTTPKTGVFAFNHQPTQNTGGSTLTVPRTLRPNRSHPNMRSARVNDQLDESEDESGRFIDAALTNTTLSESQEKLLSGVSPSATWTQQMPRQKSWCEPSQLVKARKHPRVTVLCVGLDNPSTIFSVLDPEQCVALLTDLFSLIETLCRKYKLIMTKTIGSRCIVVGGIGTSEHVDSHRVADAIAALALDLRKKVADGFRPAITYKKPIALRIGIHSGKVVSGQVGNDSTAGFDVTGECVDRASILESECVPGRILVSQVVHNMLKERFLFATTSNSSSTADQSATLLYFLEGRLTREQRAGTASTKTLVQLPPPSIVSVMSEEQQSLIDTSKFDVWWFTDDHLTHVAVALFHRLGLVKSLSIPPDKLSRFVLAVCQTYRDVPYHNFHHSLDVAHSLYLLVRHGQLDERLTDVQLFALLVSALCHDLEHPGLNNRFHTLSNSTLALRYNYKSVLEQHHCSLAFRILSQPDNDIQANLSPDAKAQVREILVATILSTDMAFHANYLKKALQFGEWTKDRVLTDSELQLVFCCHLKAADIFNICRPFEIARKWAEKLQVEFLCQGDLEKSLNLPVLPFMDRDNNPHVANGQKNFISMMGLGFFKVMGGMVNVYMPFAEQCERNVQDWETILETTIWDHEKDCLVEKDELQ